jgi:hypothetical protein
MIETYLKEGRVLDLKFRYYSLHERHFLQSELSWEYSNLLDLNEFPADFFTQKNIVNIVLVGNSYHEIRVLDRFPKECAWVMLYGDETFRFFLTLRVLLKPSVKGILRPFPLPEKPLRNFLSIFSSTSAYRAKKKYIFALVSNIFLALIIWFRQSSLVFLSWLFRKPNLTAPIGYTNLFYEEFCARFNLKERSSVFSKFSCIIESLRETHISFVGQRGKIWRQLITKDAIMFFKNSRCEILIRENFGGTRGSNLASSETAREFIDIASRSLFALCPPGNYSAATFRWLESLACGAVPLEIQPHPADPGYKSVVSTQVFSPIRHWRKLFEATLNMSDEGRLETLLDLKSKTLNWFSAFNQELIARR